MFNPNDLVSGEHWVIGGQALSPTGAVLVGGPYYTWGTTFFVSPTTYSYTFQPVYIPTPPPGHPGIGEVEVLELSGVIQDVSDTCGATTPTLVTVPTSGDGYLEVTGGVGNAQPWALGDHSASGNLPLSLTTSLVGPGGCPCGGGLVVGFSLSSYVSNELESGAWEVRNPSSPSSRFDSCKEYLQLLDDTYHLPIANFDLPYTSRSWSVRIKEPVLIGSGQALNVTIGCGTIALTYPGQVFSYRAAFRARIRGLW
jgi:hypothetical protein